MKFNFYEIDGITARNDAPSAPSLTVEGHMSNQSKLDALAELWEYIGDEVLIEHMEREGFKVERIEPPSREGGSIEHG